MVKATVMDDQKEEYRWIEVRDCQGFVWALYAEYQGDSLASFEGNLSGLNLNEIPGASTCETTSLRRQDGPNSDFWVIPVTEATAKDLKKRLSVADALGKHGSVLHTQLATAGELIFSACDNFHDGCVRVSMSVPIPLLEKLVNNGVLRHI